MRLKRPVDKKSPPATKPPDKLRAAGSACLDPVVRQRLRELAAFKQEHGHCNVPSTYPPNPPLALWVKYVRRRAKNRELDSELVGRLDRLGFSWALRRRSVYRLEWDAMIATLAAFKKKHGHCRVPQDLPECRQLGLWVVETRRRKKLGLLDRRRIRQLDRLGFVWDPRAQQWEKMYSALLRYRAEYGNCRVPDGDRENTALAHWVRSQRAARKRNALKQAYIERLDCIGFVWKQDLQESWDSQYAALAAFRKKFGHCRVSTLSSDHASLGNWVRTQRGKRRRCMLTEEQIRRLDELGFQWEVSPSSRRR
jgi:hypothetical protein